MFQFIGSLLDSIIPFGIFLYFTLVLYGVIKLKKPPKIVENPPKFYKVFALSATILFAIIIILKSLGKF